MMHAAVSPDALSSECQYNKQQHQLKCVTMVSFWHRF